MAALVAASRSSCCESVSSLALTSAYDFGSRRVFAPPPVVSGLAAAITILASGWILACRFLAWQFLACRLLACRLLDHRIKPLADRHAGAPRGLPRGLERLGTTPSGLPRHVRCHAHFRALNGEGAGRL